MREKIASIVLAGMFVLLAGSFTDHGGDVGMERWNVGEDGDGTSDSSTTMAGFKWIEQFGNDARTTCWDLSISDSGIYLAGATNGEFVDENLGYDDGYLRKYNFDGTHAWTYQFGTQYSEWVYNVGTYKDFIYVTFETTYPAPIGRVNALLKFDKDGNYIWGRKFTVINPQDIFVNQDGIYMTGRIKGDCAILYIDHAGYQQWLYNFGTLADDTGTGIWIQKGDAYVTGWTMGSFPGFTNAGSTDFFIAKVPLMGKLDWVNQMGTSGQDITYRMSILDGTYIYTCGDTWGSFPGFTNAGSADAVIVKCDLQGNAVINQFGTDAWDGLWGVYADTNQDLVFFSGGTDGSFPGFTNGGKCDGLVVSTDENLVVDTIFQFGGDGNEYCQAIDGLSTKVFVCGDVVGQLPGQTQYGTGDSFVGMLAGEPYISIDPTSIDFGSIEIWDAQSVGLELSNEGSDNLIVSDLSFASGGSPFFTLSNGPTLPITVVPGGSITLTIEYHPWEVGTHSSTLVITSNDPAQGVVEVTIAGSSYQPEVPPEDLVEDTGDFFEDATNDGTLVGVGPGNSADEKLADLAAKLDEAIAQIEAGDIEDAIGTLNAILKKCDGDPTPPDQVEGEAAEELASRIQWLIETLEGE